MTRGALLYDAWWAMNGSPEPTTNFGLWSTQSTNTRSGSVTWRCKECHGWDYVGRDGRYGSGSHFTGFPGVWNARTKNWTVVFDLIKGAGGSHDLSAVLSDSDVLDLTKFIVDGLVNTSEYINSSGDAIGNASNGQPLFASNCSSCHGTDGRQIIFDGTGGVGWLANDNPQEVLHKIRWGNPGSSMPSMVANGLTAQQIRDLFAYAQTLPES